MKKNEIIISSLEDVLSKMVKTEVVVSCTYTHTVPGKQYENFKPSFHITEKYNCNGVQFEDQYLMARQNQLMNHAQKLGSQAEKRILLDVKLKGLDDMRVRYKDGIACPSVTTITGYDKVFHINNDRLAYLSARGTACHTMIEAKIKNEEYTIDQPTLLELAKKEEDSATDLEKIKVGIEGFFNKHKKDFEFNQIEIEGFNTELAISGRCDAIGTYKGKKAIIDFKTRGILNDDFIQMAGYSYLNGKEFEDVEIFVGVPINIKNKSCFGAPSVRENIDYYRSEFIKKRAEFMEVYGV